MGFFSWKTSDTNRSISNCYSNRSTFPVYMITRDGQVFKEDDYEGYGCFDGKDIYVLAAELNGFTTGDDDAKRQAFFDNIWIRGIRKGKKTYIHRVDFNRYDDILEAEGKSPNDLVSDYGWKSFGDSGEFAYFDDNGFEMPKLVERLQCDPKDKNNWKKYWDSLPFPESCIDQGYFYHTEDDEDE